MEIAQEHVYELLEKYSTLLPHEIESLTYEEAKQEALEVWYSLEASKEKFNLSYS